MKKSVLILASALSLFASAAHALSFQNHESNIKACVYNRDDNETVCSNLELSYPQFHGQDALNFYILNSLVTKSSGVDLFFDHSISPILRADQVKRGFENGMRAFLRKDIMEDHILDISAIGRAGPYVSLSVFFKSGFMGGPFDRYIENKVWDLHNNRSVPLNAILVSNNKRRELLALQKLAIAQQFNVNISEHHLPISLSDDWGFSVNALSFRFAGWHHFTEATTGAEIKIPVHQLEGIIRPEILDAARQWQGFR